MPGYRSLVLVVSCLSLWSASPASANPGRAPKSAAILDLNTATFEQLLAFDGIGRMYAEKVYQARPFRARAELVQRRVLPVSVYLAIKHRLYTSPAPAEATETASAAVPSGMVNLNEASEDDLARIPGIGIRYAALIVQGRPYRTEVELVARRIMPKAAFDRAQNWIAVPR